MWPASLCLLPEVHHCMAGLGPTQLAWLSADLQTLPRRSLGSEPKIDKLDVVVAVQQNVLQFDIPVYDLQAASMPPEPEVQSMSPRSLPRLC